MGVYDSYLQANQAGQNALASSHQLGIGQPTAVDRFMEGLKSGQDRLAKARSMTLQEKLNESLMKQREATASREQNALDYEISQRPLKERANASEASYKDALAYRALNPIEKIDPASAQFSDEESNLWTRDRENVIKPVLDPLTGKQMKSYRAPVSPYFGTPPGRWSPVPGEPGAPLKRMNSVTGEVEDVTQTPKAPIPGEVPLARPRVAPPVAAVTAMTENRANLAELDAAIEAAKANPQALSTQNTLIPDILSQRLDPKGVATRAKVAKVSAIKIHEMTGSAQTVGEVARLKPFLPAAGDDPKTIVTKLEGMRAEYKRIMEARAAQIGSSQYLPVGDSGGVKTKQGPSGETLYQHPDGVYRTRKP